MTLSPSFSGRFCASRPSQGSLVTQLLQTSLGLPSQGLSVAVQIVGCGTVRGYGQRRGQLGIKGRAVWYGYQVNATWRQWCGQTGPSTHDASRTNSDSRTKTGDFGSCPPNGDPPSMGSIRKPNWTGSWIPRVMTVGATTSPSQRTTGWIRLLARDPRSRFATTNVPSIWRKQGGFLGARSAWAWCPLSRIGTYCRSMLGRSTTKGKSTRPNSAEMVATTTGTG